MKEIDKHLKLRNKKVPLGDLEDIPNDFYKNIIVEYGYWLEGLICKEIQPITKDQQRFLSEFKKTRNKELKDVIGNNFFVAMYLWKGESWINLNSLNLERTTEKIITEPKIDTTSSSKVETIDYSATLKHNTKSKKIKSKKPETQPGSFSLDSSKKKYRVRMAPLISKWQTFSTISKKNKYYRDLKPKPKPKSVFPKLDPDKTYRWTDQGFQTREGHKIMSSKGYRNSKKK